MMYELIVNTTKRTELIDITYDIEKILKESKVEEGIMTLFVPHTTAGVTINEDADPTVVEDMLMVLNKVIPFEANYKHIEGNSAAHIKTSLIGSSENIIIKDNKLVLGTWQGIFFGEFDGPRKRKLYVKIIE